MKYITFNEDVAIQIGIEEAVMLQHIAEKKKIEAIDDIELKLWSKTKIRELLKSLKKQNLCLVKESVLYFNSNEYCKRFFATDNTNDEKEEFVDIKHKYTDDFEKVWKYYNKGKTNPGSKKNAFIKWKQKKLSKLPIPIVFEIIDLYKNSVSDVSYTKHFATFLSQEIYEAFSPDLVEIVSDEQVWKGYLFKHNNTFYTYNEDKLIKKIVLTDNEMKMLQKQGLLKWL
jgi:hypothetical protein